MSSCKTFVSPRLWWRSSSVSLTACHVSLPHSEGMLQLRQGAPAVQPDPRLRVRDGGLSPGVLLPGGGQETGGTNRRPASPFPYLPLRGFHRARRQRVVKFAPRSGLWCLQLPRLFIRLINDRAAHTKAAGFGEMVWKIRCGTAVVHARGCHRVWVREIVFFSSKCHPCRPLNVFFPFIRGSRSQPIRSSSRLGPTVAYGSVARDAICLMSAVDSSKDEIYRFHSPAGRDSGN